MLELLKKFQSPITYYGSIEHEIIQEDGAPFLIVKTNLCERPIKLLIDTGASISLISKDLIGEKTYKRDCRINLYGIVGKDVCINTEGIVYAFLIMRNQLVDTTFHVIEGKYAGPGDGYLGYDFLSLYKTRVNLEKMSLKISLKDTMISVNPPQEKPTNFLNILAENYDFEKQGGKRPKAAKEKYGQTEYFRASAFFIGNLKERCNMKVHKIVNGNLNKITDYISGVNRQRSKIIFDSLELLHCEKAEKDFILNICNTFPYQFYLEGDTLGSSNVITHHIKLIPNPKPVNVRQYRIPESHKRFLAEIIQDYEKQGIIEKCQSSFNSPAMLVPKKEKGGTKDDFRLVVDYKRLNEITEIQNFPIPLIDDILNGLSGCRYFTTLDLKGASHQIYVDINSRDYTAFTANNFKYRWVRMPMGLASAPLTWQRAINTILKDWIGKGVYVYLDDVII